MGVEPDTKRTAETVPDSTTPRAGSRFGRYLLDRKLGAGGMGTVFLASDPQLKRTVAIKILPRERAENPTLVRRFHAEAQSAAQLRHDHIVTVYEAGEIDGFLYMALEYVEGQDVFQMLVERGRLGVAESIDVARQVTLALAHAFERGIVHRDVKPSNLLVDPRGVVKLADMGLARSVDETDDAGITRAGTTVGTVDYMAPEQARDSKAADIRSDVYSLGCTLYHMLSGSPPFPAGTLTNKLFAHVSKERPDPRRFNPAIPAPVVAVLHRMMARSPRKRYQTPAELLAALERVAAEVDDLDESVGNRVGVASGPSALPETSEVDKPARTSSTVPARRSRSVRRSSGTSGRHRRRRSRRNERPEWVLPVAGLAVLLVIAGVLWVARPGAVTGEPTAVVESGDTDDTDEPPAVEPPPDPDPDPDPGPRPRPEPDRPPRPRPVPKPPVDDGSPLGIGHAGERGALPDWIADVPTREQALAGNASDLPVVNVGWREGVASRHRDLDDALAAAPAGGAVLKLVGPGPFVLTASTLEDRGRLILVGDGETRSTVRIRSDVTRRNDSLFELRSTSLTLIDVDVIGDFRDERLADRPRVISVVGGDLALRRCSITVDGEPRGATGTALHLGGDGGGRGGFALLDRTFVRGGRLIAVDADRPELDLVLWNSVLATERGPAVRLAGAAGGTAADAERELRIVSSTLFAGTEAVEARAPGDPAQPAGTRITAVNSVFAARSLRGSTLFDVVDWPLASDERRFAGLAWSMQSSIALGWARTVRRTLPEPEAFEGYAGWQRMVDPGVAPTQFLPRTWPAVRRRRVAELAPSEFDRETAPAASIAATHGGKPGADATELAAPGSASIAAAHRAAARPALIPELVPAASAPQTIRIDASAEDLGRALLRMDWPDGARVVVTGTGVCQSTPIRVVGKSLRLEFVPKPGSKLPFVIRGRGVRPDAVDEKNGAFNAFLSVEDGRLEIVNGVFQLPAVAVGATPEWFLAVRDGDFAIRGSAVVGPERDAATTKGLVNWVRGPDAEDSGSRSGFVVDSFLVAEAPVITADLRQRRLVVSNSVLASGSEAIAVDVRGFDPRLDAVLDLRDSTLTSSGTVIAVEGSRLVGEVSSPLAVHADRNVFGSRPVFPGAAERPRLLQLSKELVAQRQIRWNGRDNAFWDGFATGVGEEGDSPSPGDFEREWIDAWGAESVSRPAFGPGAVAFAVENPGRHPLHPRLWELAPEAAASRWRLDGGSVGADVSPEAAEKDARERRR